MNVGRGENEIHENFPFDPKNCHVDFKGNIIYDPSFDS